jgi:hypothetical protein
MYLTHPNFVLLLISSGCPASFHADVALGDIIMATPPLAWPLLGGGGPSLFSLVQWLKII